VADDHRGKGRVGRRTNEQEENLQSVRGQKKWGTKYTEDSGSGSKLNWVEDCLSNPDDGQRGGGSRGGGDRATSRKLRGASGGRAPDAIPPVEELATTHGGGKRAAQKRVH